MTITSQRYASGGVVGSAAFFNPTIDPYFRNDDGSIDYTTTNGYWNYGSGRGEDFTPNTLLGAGPLSQLYDRDNTARAKRFIGNAQIDYKVHGFEALRFNLNLGLDVSSAKTYDGVNPGSFQAYTDTEARGWGQYSWTTNFRRNQLLEFYANFNKEWGIHHLDVMAGYSWQHFYSSDHSVSYFNETHEQKGEDSRYPFNRQENYLLSFYGRLNYSIASKYLFSFTLRDDASSRFSKDTRWGLFPSGAFAWNIAEENFLKDSRAVSALKLRVSVGQTGQQEIGSNYPYLARYYMSTDVYKTYYMGSAGHMFYLTPGAYDPNIKWETTTTYNVGLDSAILMNPQVWVASGHVTTFNDPLIDCKSCKMRHRADKLIEGWLAENPMPDVNVEAMTNDEMVAFIREQQIPCPGCGKSDFTDIRKFNLMFKTHQGVTEDTAAEVYLRPETAQGIFVNFKNIQRTTRRKIPFGVCQIGKSFRNEITPGNFTFRTREFEQMECEFFCKPGTDLEWFAYWRGFCRDWLVGLGMNEENLRLRDHEKEELSFYSKATTDFEYLFPFGWGELWGVADRTNYDLTQHQKFSGQDMDYFDQEKNEHYIPYVIEPSLGADRVTLAFLCEAYDEEVVDAAKNDTRVVMHFHPALAPFKCAVLPLSKKLSEPATELYHKLQKRFMCDYDEAGSIGKRYRRQDEIGTPYCVTFDFESAEDGCVTVRDRDSMQQERIPMEQLEDYIAARIRF